MGNIEWQHCGLSNEEISDSDYRAAELNFLYTVVKAMNRMLDGYNLTQSMHHLENLYDVNVEKLQQEDLIKIHPMSNRRRYFTVTTAGQQICNNTKREGIGVGDRGGDTPHRVGCELAVRYLEQKPGVRYAISFVSIQGSQKKVDVVGKDSDGTITDVIEVESGKTAREGKPTNNRVGINNYKSIEKDYDMLRSIDDATAIWVMRTGAIAARVLQILNNAGKTEITNPTRVKKEARTEFNANRVEPNGGEGMNKILTFKNLRNKIEN
jgi:hypothetical protein